MCIARRSCFSRPELRFSEFRLRVIPTSALHEKDGHCWRLCCGSTIHKKIVRLAVNAASSHPSSSDQPGCAHPDGAENLTARSNTTMVERPGLWRRLPSLQRELICLEGQSRWSVEAMPSGQNCRRLLCIYQVCITFFTVIDVSTSSHHHPYRHHQSSLASHRRYRRLSAASKRSRWQS